jgi:Domain of unknown function (DUF4214)
MRQGVGIRQATGVVVTMFVLAALLPLLTPCGAQAQSGQSFVIQPYATVDVSQLLPADLDPNPPVFFQRERRLHPDPARLQDEKTAAHAGAAQDGAASDVTRGPMNVNLLTNFIGLRLSESGGAIPPDNGTAVGPNHVFEVVNSRGRIFDKGTGATISTINLNTFFNVPGVSLSDPIMRFDLATSRWFVGIITVENNGSRWLLAVSTTSDPTGVFVLYQFTTVNSGQDFPNMGISDDKVVLTANAFLCTNPCGTSFQGAEFLVFNKANLVAGVAAATNFFPPDNTAFTLRAAQNLSPDNTIYMTMYPGAGTTLRVYRVTGVPPGASFTTVNRTILSIAVPPDAVQSGGTPLIATNDNGLLDAAFRGNSLFTTGTSGCTPSGDASTRACLRVIEILNPATTATVNQDFNFGLSGIYMYFPALSITSAGDVISVFSRSSTSEFAGVWASGRLSSDALNTYQPPALIKAGEAHYSPFSSRWGDYSSVAIDPSDQTKAWVSGEYARVEGGSEWGTWITALQLASPVSAFAAGFYQIVLGRMPDDDGLAGWTRFLAANCNASGFSTIGDSFFDSVEFRTSRPQTLNGLVTLLYEAFLGRAPEPGGLAGWAEVFREDRVSLATGGFIPSAEFQGLVPNPHDPAQVTPVVTRFYREILGRAPDPGGLAAWVNYIVTTGDLDGVAVAFLTSAEFEARALTFRDYVRILYRTFLGREPDPGGWDGWESVLRGDLLGVINGSFVPSPEFQSRIPLVCAS